MKSCLPRGLSMVTLIVTVSGCLSSVDDAVSKKSDRRNALSKSAFGENRARSRCPFPRSLGLGLRAVAVTEHRGRSSGGHPPSCRPRSFKAASFLSCSPCCSPCCSCTTCPTYWTCPWRHWRVRIQVDVISASNSVFSVLVRRTLKRKLSRCVLEKRRNVFSKAFY